MGQYRLCAIPFPSSLQKRMSSFVKDGKAVFFGYKGLYTFNGVEKFNFYSFEFTIPG